MPYSSKKQGFSAVAPGLTIHGTPPGDRVTGPRATAEKPFSGAVECWECRWWEPAPDECPFCPEPCEQAGNRTGWVLAVTWFDARCEAFARLAELGLYDVVPEVERA
jgi:hypothetical protein